MTTETSTAVRLSMKARTKDAYTFIARQGRCRPEPKDMFFKESKIQSLPAKSLCKKCPVRLHCLLHALYYPEYHGVWGGMNERERTQLRRKYHRQFVATASYDDMIALLQRIEENNEEQLHAIA